MNDLSGLLGRVGERKDILLVVLLLAVVFMMVLPLPPLLLDILIAVNITISVVLLMMSVYIGSPLQFSVFPAVLLITTLFRLALSVSTTRMILLQADAGQIVNTFGSFVVGGNLVVGIIIFLIITIVQFLVITKGAERVAEVSARFSLDAMPGKQMSIDGDMRAGVIDVNEARARRAVIEKESQMFGSMDGAMKFVKGDAIAGLIIIVVNILGGIAIGVTQKGLSTADALQLYAVLTVGDGMVSQVPALLIAITAGIIVTRVSSDESADLGSDIGEQVVAQPKALLIGGLLLVLFGLIPGFPTLTFLALALLVGGGGYFMLWRQRAQASAGSRDLPALLAQGAGAPSAKARGKAGGGKPKAGRLAEQEEFALTVPLLIDVDASLQERLEAMSLNEELVRVRRALYLDFGVPFPGIHLRFNEAMGDGEYLVQLQEVPVARGCLRSGWLLVRERAAQLELLAVPHEPAELQVPGEEASWVEQAHQDRLERSGCACLGLEQVLTWHLSHVLREYAEDFIGIQETRYLLEQMEQGYGELVKEAQRIVPLQRMTEILQRLVGEDISIRNMRAILEAMVEWGQKEKDVVQLTEYIRSSLKRYICYKYSSGNNILPAYLLDQAVEEQIRGGIRQTSAGSYLALDPAITQAFLERVRQTVGDLAQMQNRPVLIVSMDIRRYVRKLVESDYAGLPVLSYQELTQQINIQPLGRIVL
ncbi:TPA: EscV/YscV/HrcV family type III secretion system export apparatus protein [Pseudomonas aeruginosa]|uniref:SctV family type III secretion system export apparatus subunit PcrD n=1 Tax=Pseudomonas aeruginosa TaxID=287 RepID=UPI00066E0096|nr:SctV family type III secretion system export apparatus subunit PcrD [Pseudomonas aeruginosa]TEH75345.1 EscV/YscV/HrcV family type III secretion system export apparatus protein [Pseudomonas aeruginosa]TEH79982.1 EscV/YscV/HrcV family type III secretion system export apparatus protein [Pseudomonas aeruginosa]HBO9436377.1 EscV/YscV/HrcV family type III secretion system export apparatus protein [Pseudomonas aeruginosa]HBO9444855.1 EscV/YscV/HrcV family type III secretion system export apparatus 